MSSLLLLAAALIALASAALLFALERRRRHHEAVMARLRSLIPEETGARTAAPEPENRLVLWMLDQLWRAGIEPAPWLVWAFWGGLSASFLGGGVHYGPAGAVVMPALFCLVVYLFVIWRIARRRRAMVEQLPMFVDHLIRAVNIGNTIDAALISATGEAKEPLRSVFERVVREMQLGGALDEALDKSARLYDLREVRVLTLAVRVNRRYGSSIQGMLKSIVTMIRQGESARRELRALTGETRLSAWVLGLMPMSLALYMVAASPGYMATMWNDPIGRIVLLLAAGFQLIGGGILWRMLRSM